MEEKARSDQASGRRASRVEEVGTSHEEAETEAEVKRKKKAKLKPIKDPAEQARAEVDAALNPGEPGKGAAMC